MFSSPPFSLEQKGIWMRKILTCQPPIKQKLFCTKKKGIECPNSTANENRNKTEGNAPPKLKDCAI